MAFVANESAHALTEDFNPSTPRNTPPFTINSFANRMAGGKTRPNAIANLVGLGSTESAATAFVEAESISLTVSA